jgi:Predicted membrane protein involved in D-alanine export
MSFVSMQFLLFVILAVAGYYLIPRKFQWIWLLIFSYIYYAFAGSKYLFFMVFTTLTTYGAALMIDAISQQALDKHQAKVRKRLFVVLGLLLNFGMLAILKYANFGIANFNTIFRTNFTSVNILLPLGISFYTFQSMGYLLDVYWGKCKAERNPLRFALFVSFFPQILQGPIGRFSRLASQLYEQHSFDIKRIEQGVLLILWGYFKKMVIADNAAVFVDTIFGDYLIYPGLSIAAVLFYSIQLYADFSGGMDVVKGIASLFGVNLDDNFKRPYFARSITDFWHRWHITLGTWMKDYIFYPLSLSRGMNRFGKFARKHLGKSIGRTLPICVANIVVFLVVGIWHGAAWHFIIYGLYNGLIIAFSGLMMNNYRKWKKHLRINEKSRTWIVFQILRTFLLVNISWFFDRADSVGTAMAMMRNAFTNFDLGALWRFSSDTPAGSLISLRLAIIIFGCIILFIVSFIQERGVDIQSAITSKPWLIRFIIYLLLILALPLLGQPPSLTGGFIYAQF